MTVTIALPFEIVTRCQHYGRGLVAAFADVRSSDSESFVKSRLLSSDGVEKDPVAQGRAKMAECAFCRWAVLDIEKLNWTMRQPDDGTDIKWRNVLLDIKHTAYPDGVLIWPRKKNERYKEKRFDVIVLVRGIEPYFELAGCVSKKRFIKEHKIAGPGHHLREGTWFMEAELLRSVSELKEYVEAQA
jgi:hypothetical protein